MLPVIQSIYAGCYQRMELNLPLGFRIAAELARKTATSDGRQEAVTWCSPAPSN